MGLDECMTEFAVFLRGVNVGGVKVLMKDLTRILEAEGFSNVTTLLASGNVILDAATADPAAVQQRCNELLAAEYGRPVPTLAYTAEEIRALAQPFPLALPSPVEEHHGYLTLCETEQDAQELGRTAQALAAPEQCQVAGRAVFWISRKGASTTAPLAKLMTAQARKRILTTRNHNTLVKIAKIIG